MLSPAPHFSSRWLVPLERTIDAMLDPRRCERAVILVLLGYMAVWALFAIVSKSAQAVHSDTAEIVVLSRALDWGSPKHPTLLPAIAGAWFAIFPLTDAFAHLLAVSTAALALYVCWHVSGLWLDREKRVAALFLLMLVPSYNFASLKFDHNTTQALFWAAAIYAFVRAFWSRDWLWSVLSGIAGAAAIMAKYWGAVLVAGLGIAALLDRRRAAYFGSRAPWIGMLVGAALLVPHVQWLVQNEFVSVTHATRFVTTTSDVAGAIVKFIASPFAYVVLAVIAMALVVRPPRTALTDVALPAEDDRRLAISMFAAPFAVAILGAIAFELILSSLFAASMLTLLPVILLSSPNVVVTRHVTIGLAAAAFAFALGALILSPIVALVTLRESGRYETEHMHRLATEAERAWRETSDRPLRLVAGPYAYANVLAFYLADRPLSLSIYPRRTTALIVDPGIAREGFLVICPAEDEPCSAALMPYAPGGRPVVDREIVSTPTLWGVAGRTRHFVIRTVAPAL
jgi:hypothetical protein